jgi:hypothetical protein
MWLWDWLPAAVFLGFFFLVLQVSFGLVIAHVHASARGGIGPICPVAAAAVPAADPAQDSWLDEARVRNVLVSR